MDIKKYIESGVLENYVLGLLSQKEAAEVISYMAQYPEIRKEVNTIELALEIFADSQKVKAPPGLESIILDRINKDSTTRPPSDSNGKSRPNNKFGDYFLGFLAIGIAMVAAWSILQYQNQSQKLASLSAEQSQLEVDCAEKDNTIESLQEQLIILRASDNVKVPMKGTDKAPTAIAHVIYNPSSKKSYLDVIRLPLPPTDKQYQLWAIVDGTPVDMGVFDIVLNGNPLQEVPFIENPQAFAVTLEKRGGNPTPTLEEMVVIGNMTAS